MAETVKKMTSFEKFCYSVGHVLNDLCASMWFSYLLVYFEKVLEFSPNQAGLVLLVGQLADGASTPVVGVFSDKENKIAACTRYGRRKIWHLIGTLCVLLSFPFIFSPCIGCQDASTNSQLIYYCLFVIVFQFGWACVQISHLALIPDLTTKKHQRTELNSIRYAFTVFSNLAVYSVAFALLFESTVEVSNQEDVFFNSSSTSTFSTMSSSTTEGFTASNITPEDSDEFRNISLFCVVVGTIFTIIFHAGVREPPYEAPQRVNEQGVENSNYMGKSDWFKIPSFYQVAVLYMATRLFVNLYQVYTPLYVEDTLNLDKSAVASVPFVMYAAGFIGSTIMKQVNKKIGRKATFSVGCIIGLIGCAGIYFGQSESYEKWGVYIVAALLGIGGSTLLITCLSITADLIGSNVETGAFVYAFMSFVDKVSNGIVIMVIQNASNSGGADFYRNVITFACGSSCILGLLSILSIKIVEGRFKKECPVFTEESSSEVSEDEKNIASIIGEKTGYDGPMITRLQDTDCDKSQVAIIQKLDAKHLNSLSQVES